MPLSCCSSSEVRGSHLVTKEVATVDHEVSGISTNGAAPFHRSTCPVCRALPTPAARHRTTAKALLRRDRLKSARVSTRAILGWAELDLGLGDAAGRVDTPDEWFARAMGIPIVEEREWSPRLGRYVNTPRLRVPPFLRRNPGTDGKRGGSSLFDAVRARIEFSGNAADPDPVIETVIPKETTSDKLRSSVEGRVVHLHSYFERLVQTLWRMATEEHVEASLPPTVFSYRPGRSRFDALWALRKAAAAGFVFASDFDIAACFRSMPVSAVEHALAAELPGVGRALRDLALSFMRSHIFRRPTHPDRRPGAPTPQAAWSPPQGHLVEGSCVAPVFANLVLSHYLDKPFAALLEGKAVLLRYSDNCAIVSKSAEANIEAAAIAAALLDVPGLRIHPNKGSREPVDVRIHPLPWLGKSLHGTRVVTSPQTIARFRSELLHTPAETAHFKSLVGQICVELQFEHGRLEEFERKLLSASKVHRDSFRLLHRAWRAKRIAGGRDQSPLEESLYELATAVVAEEGADAAL